MKNRLIMITISIFLLLFTTSCQYSTKVIIDNLNSMLVSREIIVGDLNEISPNGNLIALWTGDQIIIRSIISKEVIASSNLDHKPKQYIGSTIWSPDGSKMLVFSGTINQICAFDQINIFHLSGNEVVFDNAWTMGELDCPLASWSPDGKKLVVHQNDKMYVLDSNANLLFEIKNIPENRRWVIWTENGIFAGFHYNNSFGTSVYYLGDGNSSEQELLLKSDEEYIWPASDSIEKNMALFVKASDKTSITYSVIDLRRNQVVKEIIVNNAIESGAEFREHYAISLTPKYPDFDYSNDEWFVFNWDKLEFVNCGPADFELIRYYPNFDSFLVLFRGIDYPKPVSVDFVKCQP